MAPYSSILACKIPWTEELGGLLSMGLKESDMTEQLTHTHTHTAIQENFIYETNVFIFAFR